MFYYYMLWYYGSYSSGYIVFAKKNKNKKMSHIITKCIINNNDPVNTPLILSVEKYH